MMIRRIGLSLGLAFVTAAAAGAAEPATRATDYDNVHIRVADPAKAAAWYVSALGATPSNPPTPATAQVTFGANVITITKGDSVQTSAGTLIDHIGFSYSNLDAALKNLNANGIKTASEPRDLPALRYAFVQDPNGIRVEVVKRNIKP